MPIRVTNDASAPKRSANVPLSTSFTLASWVYFNSATPARFWGPLGIYNGTDGVPAVSSTYIQLSAIASGSATLALFYPNAGTSVQINLFTAAASTWYFLGLTGAGTLSGSINAYVRSLGAKSFTTVSNTSTMDSWTPNRMEWGRDSFSGDFMDGALHHAIAFDRALTANELLKLSYDLLKERPFTIAQPNVYYRLRGNNDLWDRSGNARQMTVTAGVDWPGVRTFWPRRRPVKAASGGTTFNQSVAGTLSFAGALQKQTNKNLAGVLSFAGGLQKQTSKTFTGVLSFNGGMSAAAVFLRSNAGALSFSGGLQKQTNKVLTGTLSFVGTAQKTTSKFLAGALSFVGVVTKSLVIQKLVSGALSFAGALGTVFNAGPGGTIHFFVKKRARRSLKSL